MHFILNVTVEIKLHITRFRFIVWEFYYVYEYIMIYYREYKNIYDKTTTKAFLKVQSRIKYIQVHEWQINIKEDIYSLRFNVYYNYQKKYFFFSKDHALITHENFCLCGIYICVLKGLGQNDMYNYQYKNKTTDIYSYPEVTSILKSWVTLTI